MATSGTHAIWCGTCGEYVRPGTDGIHVPSYGHGPREESPPPKIGAGAAVALVVAPIVIVPFLLLVVVFYASR